MKRFWIRYLGWVFVGASGLLSFFAGFSFGLFLLPVFMVALPLMLWTGREGDRSSRQSAGAFLGMGMVCSFVLTVVPEWWPLYPISAGLILLGAALPVLADRGRAPEPHL